MGGYGLGSRLMSNFVYSQYIASDHRRVKVGRMVRLTYTSAMMSNRGRAKRARIVIFYLN